MENPFISQKLAKKFNLISFENTCRSSGGNILSRPFVEVILNPSSVTKDFCFLYYSLTTFKYCTSNPNSYLCQLLSNGDIVGIRILQMF